LTVFYIHSSVAYPMNACIYTVGGKFSHKMYTIEPLISYRKGHKLSFPSNLFKTVKQIAR